MSNNKTDTTRLDKIQGFDEDLEAKIDAMLDPSLPDPVDEPMKSDIQPAAGAEPAPEIDIFKDVPSAPKLDDEANLTEVDQPQLEAKPVDTIASPITDSKKTLGNQMVSSQNKSTLDPKKNPESDNEKKADAKPAPPKQKKPNLLKRWWHNKIARRLTVFILLAFLAAGLAWPTSRYVVLNSAGVRSSASLRVVDQTTGLPLKNVDVILSGKQSTTNERGEVTFNQVKLGRTNLEISRVAFAPVLQEIIIGWGSNPLGDMPLEATGAQYSFAITDFLSGKSLEGAEVSSGDASAFSDRDGEAILTVDDPQGETLVVQVMFDEYRTDSIEIPVTKTTPTQAPLVAARPIVYISKQRGTYDVYRTDADGQNQRLLLPGTGTERDSLSLLTSPSGTHAVLVSSREDRRDADGFLLDTVTIIEIGTGIARSIDYAQNVQIIDWRGSKLVYRAAYAAASASNSQRQRIISYDTDTSARSVLVSGNYFNGVVGVGGYIYYIVSSQEIGEGVFARIRIDGSGQRTLRDDRSWLLVRTTPTELRVQGEENWSAYDTVTNKLSASSEPVNYQDRSYSTNPAGTKTTWIDTRDGKNVLLLENVESGESKPVYSERGIKRPVQWLGANSVSFYVDTGDETAVYVVSLDGGDARELAAATLVNGVSGAY